ncbi:MAG: hypothetical protein JXA94_03880 [Parachlamydiales bacterium]|nr:hypothetical protein [Parachlamydiales bacterium]
MTPSEFYKQRRPELFSDSEVIAHVTLPREVLSYELSKISTNQKQDEFESLCRRLAEKFIASNLIPQVGPTGGGDGKTDSETYPVSEVISDRWFTPENGWERDENWAFAISAKESWKGKAKSDIQKIVGTKRGYTRVYFMSNQLISSKKKKETQDEFIKEFGIDVVILDGEWILEKIYNNDLIELVVDSLNLSSVYKTRVTRVGSHDAQRIKELEELEKNITDPNRYSEYDFQLVEDALESAILSRMLEKPRDEVEGKFHRALRLCKKINRRRQLMRIYYQMSWTYINWYDDYALFLENYKNFKTFISPESNITEIEEYFTLFTQVYNLYTLKLCELQNFEIDIEIEKKVIHDILQNIVDDLTRPTSSLAAKTHMCFLDLLYREKDVDLIFKELSEIFEQAKIHIDFPFEITQRIIEEIFSEVFPDNCELDNLIDVLASISAQRSSELEAGQIYFRRAIKKLDAENYLESIVYLGKSITKFAKEESQSLMYFTLIGLGVSYRNLGLIWASNQCFIAALHFSFKCFYKEGNISEKTYMTLKEIIKNELFIGRVPQLLTWYEMLLILHKTLNIDEGSEEIPFTSLCDGTLSTRLMHTNFIDTDVCQYLPDIFEHQTLWLSQNTALFKLGYVDKIIDEYRDIDIKDEKELNDYFKHIANQPFFEQMLYETNFMSNEKISLSSNLLGIEFSINLTNSIEMLLTAETLLAFFEGFLGTSLKNIHAHKEKIIINVIKSEENNIHFTFDETSHEYNFFIKRFEIQKKNQDSLWQILTMFTADIIARNFLIQNAEEHLLKLFEKEEVHQRISLILEHRTFVLNSLGDKPKMFFHDWIEYYKPKKFHMTREEPIYFSYEKKIKNNEKIKKDFIDQVPHNKIKTQTIINMQLWDKAKWKGVGFAFSKEEGIFMILAFENADAAKKIFDEWKDKVGNIDKEELIRVSIIKGINKDHPFYYKVQITINENVLLKNSIGEDQFIQIPSRFHLMVPNDSKNLDLLTSGIEHYKKYQLIPAYINHSGDVEPFFDLGIIKTLLIIKNAWEIGKNDLESVVITEKDKPIIPEEQKNKAPILDVLKKFK